MLDILREHELASNFREICKNSSNISIAVPFWGKGAAKYLGLNKISRSKKCRIICNVQSAACNPFEIKNILDLNFISIKSNPRLHSKLYAAGKWVIIGSSNASQNGLSPDQNSSIGLIELNTISDDAELVRRSNIFFDEIWNSSDTFTVDNDVISEILSNWGNQPIKGNIKRSKSILDACRDRPHLFSNVFVAAFSDDLSPKAISAVDKYSKTISHIGDARGYQFDQTFKPGAWLIELDCTDLNRPRITGCAKVTDPLIRIDISRETSVQVAIDSKIKIICGEYVSTLTNSDRHILKKNAKEILYLSNNLLLPLAKIVEMIDSHK